MTNLSPRPTSIGTPLSPCATRVMVLGAGELGKELIISLQRLGIEVIAVDRYDNAPGHQVAHRAYVIDMTNGAELEKLIALERPHLVVPEIEAISTETLMKLELDQGVTVIPTARATWLTMNREGIRRLAAEELNLPTSSYRFAQNLDELRQACEEIGFPCLVKPVMSSSGKGQSKLDSVADVTAAWDYAAAGARANAGKVIVEGLIDFDYEITLLTVRAISLSHGIETHFCAPIGHLQVNGDYVESWQPHPMSKLALERARDVARQITDNLGGLGVFGVELFVKGDMVWFSEVSPRPHDTGMVTMATQAQSEFELHAKAILGLPVNVDLRNAGASAVIYGQYDAGAIFFDGVADALAIPGTDLRLFGKPTSFVKRRMGVVLNAAADVDTAKRQAREAASKIKPNLSQRKSTAVKSTIVL